QRRHTRFSRDGSSDVCSSDLVLAEVGHPHARQQRRSDAPHRRPRYGGCDSRLRLPASAQDPSSQTARSIMPQTLVQARPPMELDGTNRSLMALPWRSGKMKHRVAAHLGLSIDDSRIRIEVDQQANQGLCLALALLVFDLIDTIALFDVSESSNTKLELRRAPRGQEFASLG